MRKQILIITIVILALVFNINATTTKKEITSNSFAISTYNQNDEITILFKKISQEQAQNLMKKYQKQFTYTFYSNQLNLLEAKIKKNNLKKITENIQVFPKTKTIEELANQLISKGIRKTTTKNKQEEILSTGSGKKVLGSSRVEYAFDGPNTITSQPQWAAQTHLEGQGQTILIVDSNGISTTHDDYKDRIIWQHNNNQVTGNHGTAVTGIATGSGKLSNYEIIGVAPKANLLLEGGFDWVSASSAASSNSVSVAITSTGTITDNDAGSPDTWCNTFKNLFYDNGILLVAALGNYGTQGFRHTAYPGGCPESIGVGYYNTQTKSVGSDSSRGPSKFYKNLVKPDLVAPGDSICTTAYASNPSTCASNLNPLYGNIGATSGATPFVGGAVALMKQNRPSSTIDEIRSGLVNYADDLGSSYTVFEQGGGALNIRRAKDARVFFSPSTLSITDDITNGNLGQTTLNIHNSFSNNVGVRAKFNPAYNIDFGRRKYTPLISFSNNDFCLDAGNSIDLGVTADGSKLDSGTYSERLSFELYDNCDFTSTPFETAGVPLAFSKNGAADTSRNLNVQVESDSGLANKYPGLTVKSLTVNGKVMDGVTPNLDVASFSTASYSKVMTKDSYKVLIVATAVLGDSQNSNQVVIRKYGYYPVDFTMTANWNVDMKLSTGQSQVFNLKTLLDSIGVTASGLNIKTDGRVIENLNLPGVNSVEVLTENQNNLILSAMTVEGKSSGKTLLGVYSIEPGTTDYTNSQEYLNKIIDPTNNALKNSISDLTLTISTGINGANLDKQYPATNSMIYYVRNCAKCSNIGMVTGSTPYGFASSFDFSKIPTKLSLFTGIQPVLIQGKINALGGSGPVTFDLQSISGNLDFDQIDSTNNYYYTGSARVKITQPDGSTANGNVINFTLNFTNPASTGISNFKTLKGEYKIEVFADSILKNNLCLKGFVTWDGINSAIEKYYFGLENSGSCDETKIGLTTINSDARGWSMVSFPTYNADFTPNFLRNYCTNLQIYKWTKNFQSKANGGGNGKTPTTFSVTSSDWSQIDVSQATPMSGYFAKSDNGCFIQAVPGVSSTTKKPALQSGWNLIGTGLADLTVDSDVFLNCKTKISSSIYTFDNNNYIITNVLQVGKGYWIQLIDACNLNAAKKDGGGIPIKISTKDITATTAQSISSRSLTS